MSTRHAFVLVAVAIALRSSAAVTIHIERHGVPAPEVTITLAERGAPIVRTVRGDEPVRVDGIALGVWRLTANAEGAWAAEQTVRVSDADSDVIVDLYPRAIVHGKVTAAAHAPIPASLSLAFRNEQQAGEVTCPISQNDYECALPAGTFDLRLKARGHLPRYKWNIALAAQKVTTLEPITLVPGAAVTGTVVAPKNTRMEAVTVTARQIGGGVPSIGAIRLEPLSPTAKVNAKGFFELDGVAPGDYAISARTDRLVSEVRHVRVIGGAEAELAHPLELVKPENVMVRVMPPSSPVSGETWRAELTASNDGDLVAVSTIEKNGLARFAAVAPGEYRLGIWSGEARWLDAPIRVTASMPPLSFLIPITEVRGKVHAGEKPLEATLHFGGAHGAVSIPIHSAADGSFDGRLPHDGDWIVDVDDERAHLHGVRLQVHVANDAPPLDLDVPSNVVAGSVLLDGAPVPGALVSMRAHGSLSQTFAGDDGRFTFSGLIAGDVELRAEHHSDLLSDIVPLTVTDGQDVPEVTLDLKAAPYLEGAVVSSAGPVPSASVYAFSLSERDPSLSPIACDADGRFRVRLPSGTTEAGVLVAAPGFAFRAVRVSLGRGAAVITVRQDVGRITLDFDGRPQFAPVIFHAGVPIYFGIASAWATASGGAIEQRRAILPSFEPGEYTVCMPGKEADTLALWSGQRPPAQCVSGVLAPGGELRLAVHVD